MSFVKKLSFLFVLALLICSFCSCGEIKDNSHEPSNLGDVSWKGTLYSAQNGLFTLYFESGVDTVEGDVADPYNLSVYCPEAYTAEIRYEGARAKLDEAEAEIIATLSGYGIGSTDKDASICGYDARYIPFSGEGIESAGVYFFNTARGFVQIYVLEVCGISDAQHEHFTEVLSTLRIHD